MGDIVAFKPPEKPDPHNVGEAKCVGCGHLWVAAAPVGTITLECPQCGAERGIWRYPVGASEGDLSFSCICGCEAMTAYYRKGRFCLRCMCCGTDQTDAIYGG